MRTFIRPPSILRRLSACAALVAGACAPAAAAENSFPTVDRVLYVQECMRNHPGPHYEMVNKCACALDRLAAEISHEDYVSLSTAANATTIGGERGSYIRESEPLQQEVRRYRALQARVKKACFITP
jgi:hypothetical protein